MHISKGARSRGAVRFQAAGFTDLRQPRTLASAAPTHVPRAIGPGVNESGRDLPEGSVAAAFDVA